MINEGLAGHARGRHFVRNLINIAFGKVEHKLPLHLCLW